MIKYTAPPWYVYGDTKKILFGPISESYYEIFSNNSHRPFWIAKVQVLDDIEQEGNLKLITNAPRMYEALQAWNRWHHEAQSAKVTGESTFSYSDFENMRNKAADLTSLILLDIDEEDAVI